MAPFTLNSNASTSQSTRPLVPSSDLRMPHVFVIPPEEEQQDNPPWCCFDAGEQLENNDGSTPSPNTHFPYVPYPSRQSEHDAPSPLSWSTSVHPRPRVPVSKKLEKKQRPEAVKIIESRSTHGRLRDTRQDSDVIEVVKVKRVREALTDLEENTQVKRSKTLMARATKALRSIKNVGTTSRRTHVKELWTSSESTARVFRGTQEQIHSQQDKTGHGPPSALPKKGSLSRANSRSLSQIFQPMKPSRVESLFTVRVPSSVVPVETHCTLPGVNPSSLPHFKHDNTNPSLNKISDTLTTDDAPNVPILPISSTKKNTNTKLSVWELHRLFSFSSPSPDDPLPGPTTTAVPSSSARSSCKQPTSALSHDYSDVRMEEDVNLDARLFDPESENQKLASRYRQACHTHHDDGFSAPHSLGDLSFEMKLDSLHFDSLSFDPEDFDVLGEGNMPR